MVELRGAFVSADAGRAFLGYLHQQKMRLTGERSRTVSRPELVERFGFDVKFAMHALRLGLQGLEFMRHGRITVPVPEPDRSLLLDVRHGRMGYREAVETIERAEGELREAVDRCGWQADHARIDVFLVNAHREHWGWGDG